MEFMTIREVTRTFQITTRMLRYYDEIGLLPSTRKEDYAYRVYDKAAIRRLQQILTLRKLRIPLKRIALIFESSEQIKIIEVLQARMCELEEDIAALTTIRDILRLFLTRLNSEAHTGATLDMLDDAEIMNVVQTLSLSKFKFQGERSMDDLNKASERLSRLTEKDVRIVYLPPATVAAIHAIGYEPERDTANEMDRFVVESDLPAIKPDLRQYGFNHPSPVDETNYHGYEMWVTIPDNMEVPSPLVKKHFAGGLYAAHMIQVGDFHEWGWLCEWVEKSLKYAPNYSVQGGEIMSGCLEEHLNYKNKVLTFIDGKRDDFQLDLLLPIKEQQ